MFESLALSATFIHICERIETAFNRIRVHSVPETDLMYDMSHINVCRLYFRRMSGYVEVARYFVDLELALESTSDAAIDRSFVGVVDESDLMSAIFVLNIESND